MFVFPETWDAWPDDVQTRCENYVRAIPTDDISQVLPLALGCPSLSEATIEGMALYDVDVLGKALDNNTFADPSKMPLPLIERALEAYQESGSYAAANTWGNRLKPFVTRFSAEDVRTLVPTLAENYEVQGSYAFSGFLSNLRETNVLPIEEFDDLCTQQGLSRLVRKWNPQLEADDAEEVDSEDDHS